jgi:septum formation protein
LTLVLASASPQRRAILEGLGIPFMVRPTDVVELGSGPPAEVAGENALRKAAAAERHDGETILGVDTLVATELDIWCKPTGEAAARETLRQLGGRTHRVISGVALVREDGTIDAATATTEVTFRALDEPTIEWYLGTGEWRGRAGGYAIQRRGALLVERIAGDYLNVVGLPLAALVELWPELLALAR